MMRSQRKSSLLFEKNATDLYHTIQLQQAPQFEIKLETATENMHAPQKLCIHMHEHVTAECVAQHAHHSFASKLGGLKTEAAVC